MFLKYLTIFLVSFKNIFLKSEIKTGFGFRLSVLVPLAFLNTALIISEFGIISLAHASATGHSR